MAGHSISAARPRRGPVREERCLEPVARCLMRTLLVPNVYFSRVWPPREGADVTCVDVVAIDRAGTGDVHVVEIKMSLADALADGVHVIMGVPAHYRWVAYQGEGLRPVGMSAMLSLQSEKPLLPKKGMGRIGVIEVVRMAGGDLGANIRLKAERFQPGDIDALVQEFQRREKPDIEFKE
ncbi:MAG: hypothetical protein NTX53_20355 [candidate division WOR-3 bacterium]|nr:hypothetical protein [candidate division WOR-3 bacterium]